MKNNNLDKGPPSLDERNKIYIYVMKAVVESRNCNFKDP